MDADRAAHASEPTMCTLKSVLKVLARGQVMSLSFHPLEVASRYRDPQLQVGGNYLPNYVESQNVSFVSVTNLMIIFPFFFLKERISGLKQP